VIHLNYIFQMQNKNVLARPLFTIIGQFTRRRRDLDLSQLNS